MLVTSPVRVPENFSRLSFLTVFVPYTPTDENTKPSVNLFVKVGNTSAIEINSLGEVVSKVRFRKSCLIYRFNPSSVLNLNDALYALHKKYTESISNKEDPYPFPKAKDYVKTDPVDPAPSISETLASNTPLAVPDVSDCRAKPLRATRKKAETKGKKAGK